MPNISVYGNPPNEISRFVLTRLQFYCIPSFDLPVRFVPPFMEFPHATKLIDFLRTVFFAVLVAVGIPGQNVAEAQSGATLYRNESTTITSPAEIQYGSLSGGNTSGSYYVAQNTAPAPILPTQPVTPPVVSAVPTAPATPTLLPPFDPYAVPNTPALFSGNPLSTAGTGSILGNSSYTGNSGVYSGNFDRFVPETYAAMRKFREATRFDYVHLPGGKGTDSFGFNEADLRMQLAIPCRFIPNNGQGQTGPGYFLIAPGANLVWWDGPAGPPDMSPNGFGAFLDLGMQPQITENFGLSTWFRLGVFSDFEHVSSDALRYQGRIEGNFNLSPELQLTAGLMYMDRARIRMIPTGGIIWTPRDDLIVRLVFPNPKVSKLLWKDNTEWWGYVQADYGGGSWNINGLGKTDYNDIKIGAGIEFETYTRIGGYFEFGGSFARELYTNGQRWASPPNVLYLKTGFIF